MLSSDPARTSSEVAHSSSSRVWSEPRTPSLLVEVGAMLNRLILSAAAA